MKGSGKTKKLVDLVIEAVNEANGDVVVIEKDRKLTFDIPYQARLIDAGIYDIGSYEFLKGAICGIHSGNYDITHIFIDNFFKLVICSLHHSISLINITIRLFICNFKLIIIYFIY